MTRSLVVALLLSGCAHSPAATVTTGPTVELALDEGRAGERPLTPDRVFEMLLRFDPQLPSYQPRRLRFLLAQPGHLSLTLYAEGADGHPGRALETLDRSYDPSLVSNGSDGKWVVEELAPGEPRRGPLWVGIAAPGGGGDPRLWATSNRSSVYMRDPDPQTPFESTRIPRTPVLRLEVAPAPPR